MSDEPMPPFIADAKARRLALGLDFPEKGHDPAVKGQPARRKSGFSAKDKWIGAGIVTTLVAGAAMLWDSQKTYSADFETASGIFQTQGITKYDDGVSGVTKYSAKENTTVEFGGEHMMGNAYFDAKRRHTNATQGAAKAMENSFKVAGDKSTYNVVIESLTPAQRAELAKQLQYSIPQNTAQVAKP